MNDQQRKEDNIVQTPFNERFPTKFRGFKIERKPLPTDDERRAQQEAYKREMELAKLYEMHI